MAENIKALRVRIKSVNSTMQLTNAMGLVASSKIRRANIAMLNARDYEKALKNAVSALASDRECQKSPYMTERDTNRTKIVIIAGDRGLAGGYNANVFRLAREYPDAEFIPIGKRACEKFAASLNSSEHFSFEDAAVLADTLCQEFKDGKFDRLGIISTKYYSVMSQEPQIEWILPLSKVNNTADAGMIFEPDCITVLENIIHEYVAGMITVCVRESFASEAAARRMAMDSASKNAQEMINDLQLKYNRARQGTITQEITEIVAGSGT